LIPVLAKAEIPRRRLLIPGRPDCGACRSHPNATVEQRLGEFGATRGKQDLSFRRHDDQFQAMVTDEGIIQLLCKNLQIHCRTNLLEGVLSEFQFAREHFHVLLFEMSLQRTGNQIAQQQQNHRRRQRKEHRQPEGH
jgi:hypothetical protein